MLILSILVACGCSGELSGRGSDGDGPSWPDGGSADAGHNGDADASADGDAAGDGGAVDSAGDPCAGVTCSGHGTCSSQGGAAFCQCEEGYHANGLSCEPGAADITVNWSQAQGGIDAKAFGVNCPACFDPSYTGNASFLAALFETTRGRGLVRLHGWGMVSQGSNESWLNSDGTWNAAKINNALAPVVNAGHPVLINIPSGPGGEEDYHDPDALASFAAELVQIVNVTHGLGVTYWEIPNERETGLDASQMATLVSKASAAMKAVDPTILVGGPAVSWIDDGYIGTVVEGCGSDIDFVSAHIYPGDGSQPDATSYDRARGVRDEVQAVRQRLGTAAPGRHLPIFIDEYNIGWNHAPAMYNHRGAVFDALVQGAVVDGGGDASAYWLFAPYHDMSLVDSGMNLRPPAHLFSLMNQHFKGQRMTTTVADPSAAYAFAAHDAATSTRALLLVNSSGLPQTWVLSFNGWAPATLERHEISSAGVAGPTSVSWATIAGAGIEVPAVSVVVLVSQGP